MTRSTVLALAVIPGTQHRDRCSLLGSRRAGGARVRLLGLYSHNCCRVEIMHLKMEYRTEDEESCDRELERFLHYVSII